MSSPDAAIKDKQYHMLLGMAEEVIRRDFLGLLWENMIFTQLQLDVIKVSIVIMTNTKNNVRLLCFKNEPLAIGSKIFMIQQWFNRI